MKYFDFMPWRFSVIETIENSEVLNVRQQCGMVWAAAELFSVLSWLDHVEVSCQNCSGIK